VQERPMPAQRHFSGNPGRTNVWFDARTSTVSATIAHPNLNDLLKMVALDSRWSPEALLCPRTYRPADVGFLRDVPRTYVLFVWLGFGLAIFLYAYDWRPSGWSVLRQQEAAAKPQRRDVDYNTGSIVIVPARGDYCWQRSTTAPEKCGIRATSIVTKRSPRWKKISAWA
jgi:hypothetical protein